MVSMPKRRIATTVTDFVVLPLTLPPQHSFPQPTTHYLYVRANAPRVPTPDTPRELFLVNVPVDATELHIRGLFSDQLGGGRVESVAFEDVRAGKGITAPVAPKKKRKRGQEDPEQGGKEVGLLPPTWDREIHHSGGTAVVTFVDKASAEAGLKNARRAAKAGTGISWDGVESRLRPLGRERYLAHHKMKYPPAAELQASVDEYMAAFSAAEAARAKTLAKQRAVPDEDGFVTVVRGGRTGPAKEDEAKAKEEELKKREQDRVKSDFYRFQVREKMKEEAKKLIGDFEEDRKRVEEIRKRKGRIRPD